MGEVRSTKRNIIASLILQVVTVLNGFIVPRLILSYFGSDVNGLVSSISQFLNYITLLEGGVSGVIMASLYKPLAENDEKKVSGIIKATNNFFQKIGLIFIVYSIGVGVVYPLVISTGYSWGYVFSLTIILSVSLFVQYFFSLTYRLLLNADRRGYIVSLTQIVFISVNLVLVLLTVHVFPSIHAIKIASVLAFLIQPIIYNRYVGKHYKIDKSISADSEALAQRWSGFGQNLAFFIHSNTDIVVLTAFTSLTNVSIYSVYFMVIHSLRNLIMSVSSAIVPSMGNVLSGNDDESRQKAFDLYEFGISLITVFIFTCGGVLITPFVMVYTSGITDANYYQPLFGVLLLIAEAVYCFRDPYVSVAYASGHFKETAKFSYIEAGINIVVSVALVKNVGLVGVAIGTVVSMVYRMIMHVIYLKNNILYRPLRKYLSNLLVYIIPVVLSSIICSFIHLEVNTYYQWILQAVITVVIVSSTMGIILLFFRRKLLRTVIRKVIKK